MLLKQMLENKIENLKNQDGFFSFNNFIFILFL